MAALGARAAEIFDPARFEREVLAAGLHDPLQMDALPNGDVLIAEMHGTLKRWRVATRDVVEVGRVPVTVSVKPDARFTRRGERDFLVEGTDLVLQPIYHLLDPAVSKDRGYRRQILFP